MAFQAFALENMLHAHRVTALDVVRLQDALAHDGPVTVDEAELLFTLEQSVNDKHHTWKDLFIDAITIHAINDVAPDGYLTAHKADWLIRYAAPQGRIPTRNTFALLSSIVAGARWIPERLIATLFDEVYCAIATGNGPLRNGFNVPPGVIIARDCDIVRHILYSAGGKDTPAISRVEAEALLAIDSVSAQGPALAAWNELFCKALGDAVLVASGWAGPDREVTVCPEATPLDQAQLLAAVQRGFARYRPLMPEERAIAALQRQRVAIITGEDVRVTTADWLASAIVRSETPSAARRMLLSALSDSSEKLAPEFQAIVAGVERAIRAA
jgi:hypothetical protein